MKAKNVRNNAKNNAKNNPKNNPKNSAKMAEKRRLEFEAYLAEKGVTGVQTEAHRKELVDLIMNKKWPELRGMSIKVSAASLDSHLHHPTSPHLTLAFRRRVLIPTSSST